MGEGEERKCRKERIGRGKKKEKVEGKGLVLVSNKLTKGGTSVEQGAVYTLN